MRYINRSLHGAFTSDKILLKSFHEATTKTKIFLYFHLVETDLNKMLSLTFHKIILLAGIKFFRLAENDKNKRPYWNTYNKFETHAAQQIIFVSRGMDPVLIKS